MIGSCQTSRVVARTISRIGWRGWRRQARTNPPTSRTIITIGPDLVQRDPVVEAEQRLDRTGRAHDVGVGDPLRARPGAGVHGDRDQRGDGRRARPRPPATVRRGLRVGVARPAARVGAGASVASAAVVTVRLRLEVVVDHLDQPGGHDRDRR